MTHSPVRRAWLAAAVSIPFASACMSSPADGSAASRLKALESASKGHLGVSALNTADGARIEYRADERFPFCSTFKVVLSSAILTRSARDEGLLARRIRYGQSDIIANSPVTGKHVADGMTVGELCAAALQYSDNAAANLLIRLLGVARGCHGVCALHRRHRVPARPHGNRTQHGDPRRPARHDDARRDGAHVTAARAG